MKDSQSNSAIGSNARELYHLVGLVIRSNPTLEESGLYALNMVQSRLDDLACQCEDDSEGGAA